MSFLAICLGAFGAHGLGELLKANKTTDIWETAVFYHFIHAVILFVLPQLNSMNSKAWTSLLTGIVVFSGSLYVLALSQIKILGAITPIGGLAFLIGWGILFFHKAE